MTDTTHDVALRVAAALADAGVNCDHCAVDLARGLVEVPADFLGQLLDTAEATQLVGWVRPQVGWQRDGVESSDFEGYSPHAAAEIAASDQRAEWHPVYVRLPASRTDAAPVMACGCSALAGRHAERCRDGFAGTLVSR